MAGRGEDQILPVLKPNEWPGWDKAVCRSLLPKVKSPYVPWVGFGYDREHSFEFIPLHALSEGSEAGQIDRIEQSAIQNLQNRRATWSMEDSYHDQVGALKYLSCRDDFFAAERILDQVFMNQAHANLKADMLAVGIPCRGLLYATQAKQGEQLLQLFMKAISAQFHSGSSAPISPGIFIVEAGVVAGQIRGMEQSGGPKDSKEGSGSVVRYVLAKKKESGLETLVILAGGRNTNRLANEIIVAFTNGLTDVNNRGNFGGEIIVQILPELTPLTHELKLEIMKLRHHLGGLVLETKDAISTEHPVIIKFKYGETNLIEGS